MAKKASAVSVGGLEAFLGLDDSDFIRGITRAQSTMRGVGKQMQSIGRTMTTYISLPLVAIGGASIKMAMDFEKTFSEIEGLVGVARSEVNMFRKEILAMSGDTSRPPQELADALYFVTSAGISGAAALEVVKNAGKAAAAGLGDTAAIADLVSSAVNAYGQENLSAAKATDILVAAVREGKAEAPAMATALGYVLPISSQMGVEFEEVAAAVAAMTRTGTDASTATTNLRQMLSDLLDPTAGARDAMERMGTSASELRKVLREDGLLAVLGFLREQMKTNEEAMSDIFGNVRALSGALDLMGENASENIQVFANLKQTTGDMDKAFETASRSSTFKFNQAMSKLKASSIELGVTLLPIFLDLVDALKSIASWFTSLSDSARNMVIVIAGLAAAAGPLLIVFGSMVTVLTALSPVIMGVVAAVAALGAGFIYLYENWEAVKERISDWNWWRNMLIDMIQFLIKYNPMTVLIQAMIDGMNYLIQLNPFMKGIQIPDPFVMAIDGLEELKGKTEEYKHQFGTFSAAITGFAKKAGAAIAGMFPGGGGGGGAMAGSSTARTPATDTTKVFKPETKKRTYGLIEIEKTYGTMLELDGLLHSMIENSLMQFGEVLGSLFSGDGGAQEFFSGILGIVADFGTQFGRALIAAGVAALAFDDLLMAPGAAIAAGGALLVAMAAVKGLLKKGPGGGGKPQGLASGGFVTSGGVFQLHKDEMVSLPRGSAVTPAHLATAGGGGSLKTEIGLRKLIIQIDRERERMGR